MENCKNCHIVKLYYSRIRTELWLNIPEINDLQSITSIMLLAFHILWLQSISLTNNHLFLFYLAFLPTLKPSSCLTVSSVDFKIKLYIISMKLHCWLLCRCLCPVKSTHIKLHCIPTWIKSFTVSYSTVIK